MKPFDFELTASHDAVRAITTAVARIDAGTIDAVDALKAEWLRNKQPLISALGLDPSTGRREVVLPKAVETTQAQYARAQDVAREYLGKKGFEDVVYVLDYCFSKLIAREVRDNAVEFERDHPANSRWAADQTRKQKQIPAGTRASKYLRHVVAAHFPTLYPQEVDAIFVAFSMAVQHLQAAENAVLVLSVNPLDLLLVSESTAGGWGSCHSLDGCYATGPLAYICDRTTAVVYAYQRTATLVEIGRNTDRGGCGYTVPTSFEPELPVKLWRQMAFVDLEVKVAVLSREYPRHIDACLDAAVLELQRVLFPGDRVHARMLRGIDSPGRSRGMWAYSGDDATAIVSVSLDAPCLTVGVLSIPCVKCGQMRHSTDGDHESPTSLICAECVGIAFRCTQCHGMRSFVRMYLLDNQHSICETCYCDYYEDHARRHRVRREYVV